MSRLYNPLAKPEDMDRFLKHAKERGEGTAEIYIERMAYVGYRITVKAGKRKLDVYEETSPHKFHVEAKPGIEDSIKAELMERPRGFPKSCRKKDLK